MKGLVLLAFLAALSLCGCSSLVTIDARSNRALNAGESYALILGDGAQSANPFVRQDVINGANRALVKNGLVPAKSIRDANLLVKVEYADFSPSAYKITNAVPVHGVVSAGGVSTFQSAQVGSAQNATMGTIVAPPQYGTVGVVPVTTEGFSKSWGAIMSAVNSRDQLEWYTCIVATDFADSRAANKAIFDEMVRWVGKDSGGKRYLYK